MRIAQNKKLHLILHDFLLKILKINGISILFIAHQIRAYPFPVILHNGTAERIIHRLVNQHRVARLRHRPDGIRDSHAHTRRLHMPLRPHLPVMVPLHPSCHGLEKAVAVLGIGIAVDVVVCQLDKRVLHIG